MAVNKVIFGNVTLIDTSEVTVTPDTIFQGKTALGANGEMQTGTFTIESELTEQDALLTELEAALEGKAGGASGSPEVVTGTVTYKSPFSPIAIIYYVDGNGNVQTTDAEGSIQVMKNSLLFAAANGESAIMDGDSSIYVYQNSKLDRLFFVGSDFSITI